MLKVKARDSTEAHGEGRTHVLATCYTLHGRREFPPKHPQTTVLGQFGKSEVDTRFHKDGLHMAPK
jgi:hypothetical protein